MSITIGSITVDDPVILAPMAGVTDLPFRRLVKGFGAGMVVSEMVASQAMVRHSRQTLRMATPGAEEAPVAVQVAGCDPAVTAEAARMAAGCGAQIIDLNFGCPVKKVVSGQAGAAIMRDEAQAARIMAAVVAAVRVPVTVKMRAGWDMQSRNAPRLARLAQDCGVQMVTVHGRTRCQFYEGRADWGIIAEVRRAVSIPVIANGDIATPEDARRCLEETGADGVMIGRASFGRPWLLGRVAHALRHGTPPPSPPPATRLAVALAHFEAMLEHYGPESGLRNARKHLAWYSRGQPGAAEFRGTITRLETPQAVRDCLQAFWEPLARQAA